MRVLAILASAGAGSRMRLSTDKPFIRLCGKELILYSLKGLESSREISNIIIAAKPKNIRRIKKLIKGNGFLKVKDVVKGGGLRPESVYNALSKSDSSFDIVLIHDAARPFLSRQLIKKVVEGAKRYGAAISAVACKPTIKEALPSSPFVKKTLNRALLWEAQTPQAFKRRLLVKAYENAGRDLSRFTDDASLLENIGKSVKIVNGDYRNIKITTPEDLAFAETIIKKRC